MPLFGKKKPQEPQPDMGFGASSGGIPTEEVSMMRQRGYQDNQIIQTLQNRGYNSDEVYSAMSQADMSRSAGPLPMQQMQNMPPPIMSQPMSQPPMQQMGEERSISAPEKERIEEVAEAIIDEKWKELMGDISKVVEWKRVVDSRLDKIEQQISDLRANFDTLHKGVLGRISDYDKNLTNVGVEIKAMEKVFQQILPTFTENVNRLSRMVKK